MKILWQIAILLLLSTVIVLAFLWAPLAKGLGEFTRIIYFHVPVAWITVLAFLISAVYSLLYLKKREIKFDWIAEAANHAEEQRLEKKLDALYDRVKCVEDDLDVYET